LKILLWLEWVEMEKVGFGLTGPGGDFVAPGKKGETERGRKKRSQKEFGIISYLSIWKGA
jgi:hypothetical protein